MGDALHAFVRERAGYRCEYCRLREEDQVLQPFHVEHVIPRRHDGTDDPDNLCYSCAFCNWYKGTNLAGLIGGRIVGLYHPRRQKLEAAFPLGRHDTRRPDQNWKGHGSSIEIERRTPCDVARNTSLRRPLSAQGLVSSARFDTNLPPLTASPPSAAAAASPAPPSSRAGRSR
jgi:hypothetical protein